MTVNEIKRMVMPSEKQSPHGYLSSGSTILNLACSGHPRRAFPKGSYIYFVGDTSSGKTFLTLTCFAEAANNPAFDEYDLIFDNAENGALMNFKKFFGSKMAGRVKEPDGGSSVTLQDFYFSLDDSRKAKKPFIRVLDSMDSVSSLEEGRTFGKQKLAHRKGRKMPGSYGDGKAKINSSGIRQIMSFVRDSGSILIVISQTRDNIDAMGYGDRKTRSGGRALSFYATLEMWTSQCGHIIKEVNDKKRELGIYSLIRVKKNRVQGKDRTVKVPIYHSLGIDDLGSCVDYLLDEGYWKKVKGKIIAKELDCVASRENLVRHVEENDQQRELQAIVKQCWDEIEAQCTIERASRYD